MAKRKKKEETDEVRRKKSQAKEHNKILKSILIIIAFIVVGFLLFMFISNALNSFEYQGVKFNIVKFCDAGPPCLVTYQTSLPVKVSGDNIRVVRESEKTNDYNFYLRSDPRKLDVNFTGKVAYKELMVLNFEEGSFACEGKGSIAAANLIKLYEILGTRVVTDENATCDALGRYSIVNVVPGNETKIEHFYPACYTITIKDCEILEGTEKFMIETFVEVNKALKN